MHRPVVEGGLGRAVDVGARRDAFLNGGEQGEGLEGRTGLALCLSCQVVLVFLVAAAANQGTDVARVGVDRHHGDLLRRGERLLLLLSGFLGGLLNVGIERGDNGQAAAIHLGGGVLVEQLITHVATEILVLVQAVVGGRGFGGFEVKILGLSGVMLFLGDVAVGEHTVQNQVATLLAVLGVVDGIVVGGRLGNADERCRLGKRQLAGVLGIVLLRCGLNAVGALAVVDGVQIHQQNLVFGVGFLKAQGDVGLADLTLEALLLHLVGQNGVADELLGDGGGALGAGTRQVDHDRAGNAHRVDSVVLVEALVLSCNRALKHVIADLLHGYRVAVFHVELSKQGFAIAGVNLGFAGIVVIGGVLVIGQVLQPRRAHGVHRAGATDKQHKASNQKNDAVPKRMLSASPVGVLVFTCHLSSKDTVQNIVPICKMHALILQGLTINKGSPEGRAEPHPKLGQAKYETPQGADSGTLPGSAPCG